MRKVLFGLLTSLVLLFVLVPNSYAKVMMQEKGTLTISAKEIVNDDLFIGAENVEILGVINGDVYVGAEIVKVDGTINGDLIIGGRTVTISGKIKDDVYIGGGNVVISKATIGDSLLVGAGTLTVDENSSIGGSLLTGTGMIINKAKVGRNFYAGAGNIDLNSSIGGEVRIGAGEIKLGDNTKVAKDFYYMLGEEGKSDLVIPEKVKIAGAIQKIENNWKVEPKKIGFSQGRNTMLVVSFLGSLLVGIIAIKLHSKKAEESGKQISESVFANLGVGFLILVLTVPLAIIVMLTIIGAQLSMITLALFGVSVYMAKLVTALALGSSISKQFGWNKFSLYANFVLGLTIFYGLRFIPVLGGFTSFVFTCIGLGAIMKHLYKSHN